MRMDGLFWQDQFLYGLQRGRAAAQNIADKWVAAQAMVRHS